MHRLLPILALLTLPACSPEPAAGPDTSSGPDTGKPIECWDANPCPGDLVCERGFCDLPDAEDTGVDAGDTQPADTSPDTADSGVDGGADTFHLPDFDGGDAQDSGCICNEKSECCDGCNSKNEGEVCKDPEMGLNWVCKDGQCQEECPCPPEKPCCNNDCLSKDRGTICRTKWIQECRKADKNGCGGVVGSKKVAWKCQGFEAECPPGRYDTVLKETTGNHCDADQTCVDLAGNPTNQCLDFYAGAGEVDCP